MSGLDLETRRVGRMVGGAAGEGEGVLNSLTNDFSGGCDYSRQSSRAGKCQQSGEKPDVHKPGHWWGLKVE